MLSTFDQVKDWITDNGLKRWMLFKDYTLKEKFLDSAAFPGDQADKIAMTEKYLRSVANGRAYAKGGTSAGQNDLDMCAEIRLEDFQPTYRQQVQGVGGGISGDQIGEIENRLRKSITSEIEAKMRAEKAEQERKEFYKEKKQFEDERNGVIGAIVRLASPYLPVLNQLAGGGRLVAGVDTDEPVHAAPIEVEQPEVQKTQEPDVKQPETQEENPFTDEEADELFALMARFKKVEPEYLKIIRKVVVMAESNDKNYQMARMMLVQ